MPGSPRSAGIAVQADLGRTFRADWGTGDPATDVRLACEQAGNAILAADPSALIFCEGVSENPASSGGYISTWWGGDPAEAGQYPVTLSSQGHLVYSAHDYGPNLFQQTWFNSSTTPASLDAVWNPVRLGHRRLHRAPTRPATPPRPASR